MKALLLNTAIICIILAQGCTPTLSHFEIYKLSDESAREEEITALNTKVFDDLQNAKYEDLKALMTDSLRALFDSRNDMQTFRLIPQEIAGKKMKTLDEYRVKSTLPNTRIIYKGATGNDPFTLAFTAREKETYLFFGEIKDSSKSDLLTLVYALIDGRWKIDALFFRPYAIDGKNASDFYKEAKKLSEQGDWLDAICVLGNWNTYKHPADVLKYDNEEKAEKLNQELQAIVPKESPLPYIFANVSTQPKMFSATRNFFETKSVLIISYLSNVSLADTISLKKENDQVHEAAIKKFKGIVANNWAIVYRVYNFIPTANSAPLFYKFVFKREDARSEG